METPLAYKTKPNERCDHHAAEAGDCCNCMTGRQVGKQRKKHADPPWCAAVASPVSAATCNTAHAANTMTCGHLHKVRTPRKRL
ncbi:hypothetical protein [Xanthomonas oryzae]|uniref:hypothetical protein n=1 Tax=Xanthomonas oryzae TaxID=347 RepID=UPI001314F5DE|nr:hypothetical protein [Xanthomonas oryzae]